MLVTTLAYLGGLAIQNASLYLMCQSDMKNLKDETLEPPFLVLSFEF